MDMYLLISLHCYSGELYMPPCLPRFCASDLWQRQALHPAQYPVALQEKEFVVPGENFVSHDGRRNLTDLQETSQWLGGQNVVKAILGGLLGTSEFQLMYPFVFT